MKKISLLIINLAILFLSGCHDDEINRNIEEDTPQNLIDPTVVFNNLIIEGSSKLSGHPPQPSNTNTAPFIETSENIEIVSGSTFVNTISQITSKKAKGVFFQVKGSESYYNIPSSAFTSGGRKDFNPFKSKLETHNDISFEIQLLKNMPEGTFNVSCSLYDIFNEVSNVIEFSVEVLPQ